MHYKGSTALLLLLDAMIRAPVTSAMQTSQRIISRLQGSCLCGAITWELANIHMAQICVCHCGACRRFSGSSHIPFAAVDRARMWPLMEPFYKAQTMKSYQSSSAATRYFCATCASPVVFDYHEEPNTLWIPMGSLLEDLDNGIGLDPATVHPTRDSHIFANDQAGYEDALMSYGKEGSIPRCVNFGIYKHDPCQPKPWESIPIWEKNIQFVDEKGHLLDDTKTSKETNK